MLNNHQINEFVKESKEKAHTEIKKNNQKKKYNKIKIIFFTSSEDEVVTEEEYKMKNYKKQTLD